MEVHHHPSTRSGHNRKTWTHYFWEFLMLFFAVFCGFLAEYQLEHKIERDREKQYIKSLIEDLVEDTVTLKVFENSFRANVARMDTFMRVLTHPAIKEKGAELYYFGRMATRLEPLALHDRTIQQMKNSGAFRLIRKQAVSKAVLDYYNRLIPINTLEQSEYDIRNEYRKLAISIFQPIVLDSIVNSNNEVNRPRDNPALLTYNIDLLTKLAGMTVYIKGVRLATAKQSASMNTAAKELIQTIKKEYRLK
jgi:hypothetical protein